MVFWENKQKKNKTKGKPADRMAKQRPVSLIPSTVVFMYCIDTNT